jgi:hypothetical protein
LKEDSLGEEQILSVTGLQAAPSRSDRES